VTRHCVYSYKNTNVSKHTFFVFNDDVKFLIRDPICTLWNYKVKVKANRYVPFICALGERSYSSSLSLISALEGSELSASRPGRALPPGKQPPVPTVQEVGWAPEPVWTQRLEEKSSASVGDRTLAVQSVVRDCTDWKAVVAYFNIFLEIPRKRSETFHDISTPYHPNIHKTLFVS
jgi:hypothetical protein